MHVIEGQRDHVYNRFVGSEPVIHLSVPTQKITLAWIRYRTLHALNLGMSCIVLEHLSNLRVSGWHGHGTFEYSVQHAAPSAFKRTLMLPIGIAIRKDAAGHMEGRQSNT